MPAGSKKSSSLKKVFRRTPSGRTVVHYKKKKPQQHKCASCGTELMGIPKLNPIKMQNIAKTKKRPERPYGGYLCNFCTRRKIIQKARS